MSYNSVSRGRGRGKHVTTTHNSPVAHSPLGLGSEVEFSIGNFTPMEQKPMSDEVKALFIPKLLNRQLVYRLMTDDERTKSKYLVEKSSCFMPYTKVKVVITSVKDLNDFHVVKEADQVEIEKINDCLTTAATFGLMPYHPMREQIPIACASNESNQWSRIEVLKIEEPSDCSSKYKLHIRFIDSGKEDILGPADVRALPDWALEKPRYAYQCSLIICQAASHDSLQIKKGWAPAIIDTLRNLGKYNTAAEQTAHLGLELSCFRVENDYSLVDLKLLSREDTWTSALVEHGIAKWMDGFGFRSQEDHEQQNLGDLV